MTIHDMTAVDLLAAYKGRKLSPVEATQTCLDRIARLERVSLSPRRDGREEPRDALRNERLDLADHDALDAGMEDE